MVGKVEILSRGESTPLTRLKYEDLKTKGGALYLEAIKILESKGRDPVRLDKDSSSPDGAIFIWRSPFVRVVGEEEGEGLYFSVAKNLRGLEEGQIRSDIISITAVVEDVEVELVRIRKSGIVRNRAGKFASDRQLEAVSQILRIVENGPVEPQPLPDSVVLIRVKPIKEALEDVGVGTMSQAPWIRAIKEDNKDELAEAAAQSQEISKILRREETDLERLSKRT